MKSKPRICVTCGTTYEYCPKCTKMQINLFGW